MCGAVGERAEALLKHQTYDFQYLKFALQKKNKSRYMDYQLVIDAPVWLSL